MRRAARQDKNHAAIRAAFIALGFSWRDTHQIGADFPDAVAGRAGHNMLIEIKSDKGKLSDGQERFKRTWRGAVFTIRTVQDVVDLNNTINALGL